MIPIQPGRWLAMTDLGRCECCNPDCPGSLRQMTDGPRERCRDDAVRMVTVHLQSNLLDRAYDDPIQTIPMCAACAQFHEQKAGGSCDRVSHSPDGPENLPVQAQEEEGPPPVDSVTTPVCMGCGCLMSEREYREQGACNDCRPDHLGAR